MAALTLDYEVGDTVYVAYAFPDSLYFTPTSRVVAEIKLTASGDVATVSFTAGNASADSVAVKRLYTTEAACATFIVDDIIVRADAVANLDATTSLASTAGQPTLSLGRVDT
jgi:hypothetical protein